MNNRISRATLLVVTVCFGIVATASAAPTKAASQRPATSQNKQTCVGGASLFGSYGMLVYGSGKYLSGELSFDGNCNVSGNNIAGGIAGEYSSTSVSGTYGENLDGTFNIDLNFASPASAQTYIVGVSESGNKARGIESDGSIEAIIDIQSQLTPLTSGYTTSNLSGSYVASCSGVNATELDSISFDGNGNVSGFSTYSNSGQGSNTLSGTYSVNADGTFYGSLTGSYSFNGVIDDGVSEIEYAYANGSSGALACVGKQAAPTPVNLLGYYGFVVGETENTAPGGEYYSGALYFNGSGGISGANISGGNGGQYGLNNSVTGSYTVNSNNTITLTLNLLNPTRTYTYLVGVSEFGNEASGIETDGNTVATIDLQSQLQAPPYGNASLIGTYSNSCGGNGIDLNWTSFDGNGNITTSADAYYNGGYGDNPYTGYYTVNSDGTFIGHFYGGIYNVYTMTGVLENGTGELEFTYLLSGSGGVVSCIGESTYGAINGNPVAATPTFSPLPGAFTSAQSVTLSDTTAGAVIYYTTNGTAPSTSSSIYSTPIAVSATTTIQAMAAATGYNNSAIAASTFFINAPTTAAPTFSPLPGSFTSPTNVTLSDTTPGAVIYYTTNGTAPNTGSAVYNSPIAVSATTTIQAIAVAPSFNNSGVANGTFTVTLPTAATPSFSPSAGSYASSVTVTLSDATAGAAIYYTTDGTTPTTHSSLYVSPITLSTTSTLQAIAALSGYNNSSVAGGIYTITAPPAPTPSFSPTPGTYTATQSVTLSDTLAGVAIYYTTNGSTPTTSSPVYGSPIPVNATTTIQAMAVETGYSNSTVATGTYTLNLPPAATPTPSTLPGSYGAPVAVTLSDTTPGAVVHCTTDGSVPTAGSPVCTTLTISSTAILNSIAVATGYSNSAEFSGTYTIAVPGTFTLVQHVNNASCATATTCSITLNQSITAGDLLIFEGSFYPASYISGTNNGGTFTPCLSCVGFDPTYAVDETTGGWILSAAAQSSPITLTLNTAASGAIEMWEYSVNGGTAQFDGANQIEIQNSANPTATPFNPSGSNDISVQACRANQSCVTPTSPFNADNTGNSYAWGYLSSPANWTGPTWTLSGSGTSQLTQMEFGFGVLPCSNSTFVDFGGPVGNEVSPAQLSAGTHGWQGGIWTINDGGTDLTYQTSASQTLQGATGRLCDGGDYSDSSSTGLQYSTTSPYTYVQMNGTNGVLPSTSVSVGVWYNSNVPATSTGISDDLAIFGPGAQDYVLLREFGLNGARLGEIGCGSGTSTTSVTLARNTWYWIELMYNVTGNHTMKVYNNANPPVQVGSTMTCPSVGGVQPAYITLGNVNSDNTLPAGYVIDYDGLLVSLDGIDPLLPGSALPQAATPTFSPTPGSFTGAQSVTLSDATPGATIYYTTNGSTPTTGSAVYSAAIPVSATTTINAIAGASGFSTSSVASGIYTISAPTAATPTFSPAPGSYTGAQSVTLSDATTGATIYYTTNGSTPTTGSSVYNAPIALNGSATIEAIAVANGYNNSNVATGGYTLTAATPTFSPAPGSYTGAQSVTLSDATTGATIYYTTNGTTPTTGSSVYSAPITLNGSATVEAIAVANGYNSSNVATGGYTLTAATPTFSPTPGSYNSVQAVTLSDTTAGTTIYYTTNGSIPTTSSSVYSAPIPVSATTTIEALAVATGYSNSTVATASYTITLPTAATPTFSPTPGSYTGAQSVTLSDSTAGAAIYYTTNGTTPTAGSAKYSAPVTLSGTTTIEAIAIATGYNNSAVATGAYTLTAATPTFSPAPGSFTSAQSVTLSDTTVGATIYYTTNGTTPTINSTKYTAAIPVSATTTIEAIAVATGYTNSAVATGNYTITLTAATPTFSPAPGAFTSTQSVTLSDTTTGATIYYTTNGTTPTISSTKYTAAIPLSATTTIEAISVATGYTNSAVATGTYTITLPTAATPTFSPAAGSFNSAQSVTLSDATAGTTIYYTTNGTTPTTASSVYSAPIAVNATTTIEALAVAAGYNNSAVASGTYTLTAATPTFAPAPGSFTSVQTVTLSDATAGTTIYYTTNGTTPTTASSVYSAPIAVNATSTIEAIAVATGYTNSSVATGAYTITLATAATPVLSPTPGTYSSAQSVTLSDATTGATIYYTTNGTTPTTSSPVYSAPIPVSATTTVQALAVATGYNNSAVASGTYTLTAATPTFSPAAGSFTSVQSVTLSDATAGTTIYYTTNGTTPTTSSPVYSAPIPVNATTTIEAVAVAAGYNNSAVASGTYTINLPAAATPSFSPAAGSFTSAQSVTLSDATAGATIYYTTNGATPTTGSAVYNAPIAVSATTTINAIAVVAGYTNSAVASGTFTITLKAATPTFAPTPGAFTSAQSVTLSDTTPGATIYYTTNGTTPTTGSAVYSAPIAVSATTTIEAIAVATGYSNSSVATGTYTITLSAAATPTFSPTAGSFTSPQSVTLSDTTPGATIYYTTNGTAPTTGSAVYTAAIPVSATTTIKAIAAATGYTNSAVATGAYTITLPAATAPTFSPSAGSFTSPQSVTLSDTTPGATIYYTTNGTTPTTGSAVYTAAIPVSATTTIKAIAAATGYTNSAVATGTFTINLTAGVPSFSPAPGAYTSPVTVTLSDTTPGAAIYYTTNGTAPTTSSLLYSTPFTLSATATVKAIGVATGYANSAVTTGTYTITLPTAAAPTFSPAAGSFSSTQSVTLSDTTSGAVVYYTTNGTTPTTSSALYSSPITVAATTTIKAIAVATGYANSAVASGVFTIKVGSLTATTTTLLTPSPNPSVYGQPVVLTATVSSKSGAPPNGEAVSFEQGSTLLGTGTLTGGTASISVSTLAVGTRAIKAVYGGDTNFATSTSASVNQVITQASSTTTLTSSANPSAPGASVTFTITVSGPFTGTPTGSVVLKKGTTTIGTVTLSGGKASIATKNLSSGANAMTATYNGSTDFASSSTSLTQTVAGSAVTNGGTATVTTLLTPSPNSSVYGQPVALTATVSSSSGAPPNGEIVTFKQGSTLLGTGVLTGGVASLSVSTLAVGTKAITAVYAGDANFANSTSASANQTVTPAPSQTTVIASANPSAPGQAVTFTATVSGPYTGTPTGSVVLKKGTVTLQTVALSGGTASITTKNLSVGANDMTVTYNGSADFATSSASLTQNVN